MHGDLDPGAARCRVAGCDVPPLDLRAMYPGGCQQWEWREDVPRERGPSCDCHARTPTYPVFRGNPHLPGCPQFTPNAKDRP